MFTFEQQKIILPHSSLYMFAARAKRERVDSEKVTTLKKLRYDFKFSLKKVVSSGQSGSDYAALVVAREYGLDTGGWAPQGFITVDGPKPSLGTVFNLRELEPFKEKGKNDKTAVLYAQRSQLNVDLADATLIFMSYPNVGLSKIIRYCETGTWYDLPNRQNSEQPPYRPHIVISDAVAIGMGTCGDSSYPSLTWINDVQRLMDFIKEHDVRTLNITGHQQCDDDPSWEARVANFLRFFLNQIILIHQATDKEEKEE